MNKTQKIFLGAVGGIAVLSIIGSAGDTETQKPAVAVETPAPEKSVKPEPVKPKVIHISAETLVNVTENSNPGATEGFLHSVLPGRRL